MNEKLNGQEVLAEPPTGERKPEASLAEAVETVDSSAQVTVGDDTAVEQHQADDSIPDKEQQKNEAHTETASETETLLSEIARLKEELARRDSMAERFAREGEEFRSLYPETDLQSVPDSVWNDVRRGIPLAAAYALSERRRYCTELKANEYNRTNSMRSSGSLEPTEPEYFSPAEVRAMSQSEVRANYQKIMRSMQKWH